MPRVSLHTLALSAALAVALGAYADPAADAGDRTQPSCPQADIRDVQLDGPAAIDGIRVVVSRRSPVGGAVDVRVDDGRSDRVIHVRGAISKQLSFSPALTASDLQVSLDPVFAAPRGACVDRIELLAGDTPIATVRPE
jgi:hypothetical protein